MVSQALAHPESSAKNEGQFIKTYHKQKSLFQKKAKNSPNNSKKKKKEDLFENSPLIESQKKPASSSFVQESNKCSEKKGNEEEEKKVVDARFSFAPSPNLYNQISKKESHKEGKLAVSEE